MATLDYSTLSPFNARAAQTLQSTFAAKRTRTVYALGDSLTAGAGVNGGAITYDAALYSSTGQPALQYQGGSWVQSALMASQCKWTIGGVFATGGYTAAQILATHVPQVIATASIGDTVVVLAGTNGNVLADVKAIHDTLRAAGLYTVACTIPPNSASTLSLTAGFNSGLKAYCATRDIPVVDVFSSVVDTATGLYLAAYSGGDGTHPNQLGGQQMGVAIATVLNSYYSTAVPLVEHNAAFTGQLHGHPLGTGMVLNTDFGFLVGNGTSTATIAANANFKGGQGLKYLRNDTNIDSWLGGNYTIVPGNRIRIGFALEASTAGGGFWGFRFESNTTGNKILFGLGYPGQFSNPQTACKFYIELVVPTIPDFVYRYRVGVTGVAGTYLHLGEITVQDLTVLGL